MLYNEKNKVKGKDYNHLVNQCIEFYNEIEKSTYRQRKIELIKESHRVYKLIEKNTDFPWEGAFNTVVPFLTITVDNLAPRLHAGFCGKQPYVEFKLNGVTEPDEIAEFLQTWFNSELDHVVDINKQAMKIVQTLLLEGTVYPIATYDEDYVEREEFQFADVEGGLVELDEDGNPITKTVKDKIFSGGKVKYAAFNDIYIKDDVEDWEKADIIRIVRPTYAELKLLAKNDDSYFNIDEDLLDEENRQEDKSPSQEVDDVDFIDLNQVIECYEYHVNYIYQKENQDRKDIKDWTSKRMVALITKQSETLIRLIPLKNINMNNQHVIRRIRLYPDIDESYGCSIYEKMKPIQDGASDSYNLLMNVSYICMLPFFFYSNKAGLPEDICLAPGVGVEVDDPKEVVFPTIHNISPNSFIPIFNIWSTLWERLGSIGDLQLGRPSSKANTATEVMMVIQEGNTKHNYQSNVMKSEFLSLLKTLYDLYYTYMPFDSWLYYHGQKIRVPRDKMRRPYKFYLTGSTELSNSVLELKKAEQMYQMLRKDPLSNPITLLNDIVTKFKPDSDPKRYVDPEINKAIMAFMQQKQAQAQGQQGQGGAPGQETSGQGGAPQGATPQLQKQAPNTPHEGPAQQQEGTPHGGLPDRVYTEEH